MNLGSALRRLKSLIIALQIATAVFAFNARAVAGPQCEQVFEASAAKAALAADDADSTVSKLRNRGQRTWVLYDRWLRVRVKGQPNPLIDRQLDANAIGLIHQRFERVLPHYRGYFQLAAKKQISLTEYLPLRAQARAQIIQILRNRTASFDELFAAIEVNRLMSLIHSKIEFPRAPEDAEKGKKDDSKKDKKKDKDKDEEEEEDDVPPNWQPLPDSYEPKNKDVSNSGGKPQKQYDMVKTTVVPRKRLLRMKVYDSISNSRWASSPLARPTSSPNQAPGAIVGHSKILVADANRIPMPIQYGFAPIPGKYNGFEVRETYPQEYEISINDPSLKEIEVPLQAAPSLAFQNGASVNSYLTHSGIQRNLWPTELTDFLQSLKAQNRPPLEIAEQLEKYLSQDGDYLYFSKGDVIDEKQLAELMAKLEDLKARYPLPVAFAHLKSFNCDGAALIATTLLRDFFQIPARPVGGRTVQGSKLIGNDRYYVSTSSSPLHAWIEVWDGKAWEPFDMTPKKNNPEMNGGKSDLENEEQDERQSDSQQKSSSQSQSKSESRERSEQHDKDQDREQGDEQKDGKGKDGEKATSEETGSEAPQAERDINEHLQVRQGTNGQKHSVKSSANPLEALYHALATHLKEAIINTAERRSIMGLAEEWSKATEQKQNLRATFVQVQNKIRRLFHEQAANLPKGTLSGIMTNVQRKLLGHDMTGAFTDLRALKVIAESIREHRELTAQETDFLTRIDDLMAQLRQFNHKDAKAYDVANRVARSLPGKISREWLQKKYGPGYLTLGDPALNAFAADLVGGRLKPLVLASLLRDYADLILNSEQIPNYKDQKTSQRAPVMLKSSDLVVARSALELPRMLLSPRPGEHLFAPLVEGRQFALGQREVRRVPDPKHPIERKLSVVYYDISGSMNGVPLEVVDSLLIAFVDIALTEADPFGRPVHEVILVPFDDKVYPAVRIKTREDALNFIANRIAYATRSKGSTDIQKVLLHFYDLVASAHQNSLTEKDLARILKRANLILFSDGGSTVDKPTVLKARNQIPKTVNLFMNFVGIGNSNETLIDLANSSRTTSAQSLYRDLTHATMEEAVAAAQVQYDPGAFASAERVPPALLASFQKLMSNLPPFTVTANEERVHTLARQLNFSETAGKELRNSSMVTGLLAMAREIEGLQLPRNVRIDFVDRLLTNYPQMSGRPLSKLTLYEKNALEELVKWALAI